MSHNFLYVGAVTICANG